MYAIPFLIPELLIILRFLPHGAVLKSRFTGILQFHYLQPSSVHFQYSSIRTAVSVLHDSRCLCVPVSNPYCSSRGRPCETSLLPGWRASALQRPAFSSEAAPLLRAPFSFSSALAFFYFVSVSSPGFFTILFAHTIPDCFKLSVLFLPFHPALPAYKYAFFIPEVPFEFRDFAVSFRSLISQDWYFSHTTCFPPLYQTVQKGGISTSCIQQIATIPQM